MKFSWVIFRFHDILKSLYLICLCNSSITSKYVSNIIFDLTLIKNINLFLPWFNGKTAPYKAHTTHNFHIMILFKNLCHISVNSNEIQTHTHTCDHWYCSWQLQLVSDSKTEKLWLTFSCFELAARTEMKTGVEWGRGVTRPFYTPPFLKDPPGPTAD